MDITSEVLNEIYRNLRTEFQAKIGAYKPGVDLSMLAQQVPSAGRSNLYPWLDLNYRGWKKWEGTRAEIWNREAWERYLNEKEQGYADIADDVLPVVGF